jgi:glycosyltransferase involved in cell wall biosynthesis
MPHLSVSVVVPTYNRASLLERSVGSALRQCEPGDEVIIVDDGSTDETEGIVRIFGGQVRYLRTARLGAGAARNTGVRAARGDLVAFLDSDDEWMPGKLALQRSVLEQFPDILYLFSDFGVVELSGQRRHGGLAGWRDGAIHPWDHILGDGLPSDSIPGLPAAEPGFNLHVGRLYEAFITDWCVCTITVVVRRAEAGDALHFPEDVPTYEDIECFARLAQRGLAGFTDCETAWNHRHPGPRLTDSDKATNADAALTIIGRVWGEDEEYLSIHRDEFEAVMDAHRARKVRFLLGQGRRREARDECGKFFGVPPRSYRVLTHVPGVLMGPVAGVRRRLYRQRDQARMQS